MLDSTNQLQELVWTPEMVRRFWAFESGRPENFFSFQVGRAVVRHFKKYLHGKAIVDYGAGNGYLIEELLASGHRCAAIEFDSWRLIQKIKSPNFIGARDPDDLHDWSGKFDVVFLVEVIEHLYDKELSECLSNIAAILNHHGLLIVTTPNNEDRSKHFVLSPESGKVFHRFQHVRSWSAQSLAGGMRQFQPVEIGTCDFGASVTAHYRTVSLPLRIARSMAKNILGRKPHLFGIFRIKDHA